MWIILLIRYSEIIIKELLDKVVMERKKKGLLTGNIYDHKYELHSWDVKENEQRKDI